MSGSDSYSPQPLKPRAEQARERGNQALEAISRSADLYEERKDEITPTYDGQMILMATSALLAIEARLDEIAALMRDR